MPEELPDDEMYYVYGLNGSKGTYLDEPLTPQEVGDAARGQVAKQSKDDLRNLRAHVDQAESSMRAALGIDERELDQTGWGVVFARGADPGVKKALQPLLDHRKEQAGELYEVYEGDDGYLPGDTWESFRRDHKVTPGDAIPDQMPYYLLLVGDPETIPYDFQYMADVDRAVGRIHFDNLDDYAYYAQSVVRAEEEEHPLQLPRCATFFATSNPDDRATELSSKQLIKPLAEELVGVLKKHTWDLGMVEPEDATRARLKALLGGSETPSLLFTATHGAGFDDTDTFYPVHQGALVTKEWPGPREWRERLNESFFFSADHVGSDARLWGMIAVFFACFGAGTPRQNDFYHLKERHPEMQLKMAEKALLAPLPQRLLSHPNGGALAVAGHVERAWSASFKDRGPAGPDTRDLQAFKQLFSLLMRGYPLGAAMEHMGSRYANFSIQLTSDLHHVLHTPGYIYTDELKSKVARLWTANNDARNYVIVGDPAVRLPVSATETAAAEHPIPAFEITTSSEEKPAKAKVDAEEHSKKSDSASDDDDDEGYWVVASGPGPKDPELRQRWRESIKSGYEHNEEMFRRILKAFMSPYYTTVWMNGIIFAVGILSFVAAVALSLWRNEALYALAFGGLGVAAFLGFFVSRPLQSLEENLEFITWLGVIYNTYWTRLIAAGDPKTTQQDLQAATDDAVAALEKLVDKHAEVSAKRFKLGK
ncbi:MAG: hypothetical protein PVH59_13190 [Anaerolineae bacterium]|jgi:hypothetical protein